MIKRYLIEEACYLRDFLQKTNLSSNLITKITGGNGAFIVNDQNVDKSYFLQKGDQLEVVLPVTTMGENIKSVKGEFEIVFEDAYLLIINKINNLSCIPTIKHFKDSLANYVASYYKRKGLIANIHFVNRLDAKTSGLVILAKNGYINNLLKKTSIIKKYLLEVEGILEPEKGIIETGIYRPSADSIKRAVTMDFLNSKTSYEVLNKTTTKTSIEATLHTGKTHQLRLHFAYLGHPIVGDSLYGDYQKEEILCLHSYYLEFVHPVTKQLLKFRTYPQWYQKSLEFHQ